MKEKLATYQQRVEQGIDQLLPNAQTRPSNLHAAMRYSMEAGGKRLRPVLLIAASELFPAQADPVAAAVAIECLHTYTLIHDDLPSIDDSDLRRGRPSCHVQFDEAPQSSLVTPSSPMPFNYCRRPIATHQNWPPH